MDAKAANTLMCPTFVTRFGTRFAPRALLADEGGLGKTIVAGMIIHRQLLIGLSQRILLIVPDSLVHQWLVEMLRRFNLSFSIFNDERIHQEETGNPLSSPRLELSGIKYSVLYSSTNLEKCFPSIDAGK